MNSNISSIDQIVGEYLIYRGFTQTFRSLEAEKGRDRVKQFEGGRIVEAIFGYLHTFEVDSFITLWDFMSKRFFFHLDAEYLQYSSALKSDLLKYYLINAVKNARKDKLAEFFSSYSHEILAESGDFIAGNLRSWFILPYLDEPDKDPEFAVYFTSRWAEALKSTMGNFLSLVLQSAPPPKILLLEKWFHADAQQEVRQQLALASKKVECLLTRLEKNEDRLAQLRTAVRDLSLYVQKISVATGSKPNVGLFECDEDADSKRLRAREIGQIVCRMATECVHRSSHTASLSKETRLREILGGELASLFFPHQRGSQSTGFAWDAPSRDESTGSSVIDTESTLLFQLQAWLKSLSS